MLMALLFYRAVARAAAARGAAAELVHPARAAVADLRQRPRALPGRCSSWRTCSTSRLVLAAALLVYARELPALAVRRALVGVYLPARRAGVRRRALRAGPPLAALARRSRRATLAAGDAGRAARSLANASQRCIAAGVNSACGWLPPMMNISRCSLPGSS